jgi:hypothetical protein
MKRKKFLLISAVAVTAAALPVVRYSCRDNETGDRLEYPLVLNQFCESQEILAIGIHYRRLVPAEDNKERLTALLLTDDAGNRISSTPGTAISHWLKQKISRDFMERNTIIANGWVISVTEARQCALYSMS